MEDFKSYVKIATLAEEYSMPLRIVPVCVREKHIILNVAARDQLCNQAILDALQWLVKGVELHFPILHMKVQQDTRAQIARDEQLRRDRAARLKASREAKEQEEADNDNSPTDILPTGASPFIPLEEHLARVERRKSSVIPEQSHERPPSLPPSRSEPNLSTTADEFDVGEILMDEPEDLVQVARPDGRWLSPNREVLRADSPGGEGDHSGDVASLGASIGNISDLDELDMGPEPSHRLKKSRPPVYKRLTRTTSQPSPACESAV